jgi:hypothetical protein
VSHRLGRPLVRVTSLGDSRQVSSTGFHGESYSIRRWLLKTSRWLPIEASSFLLILLCVFSLSQGLGYPWHPQPEPLTCPRDRKKGSAPDRDTPVLGHGVRTPQFIIFDSHRSPRYHPRSHSHLLLDVRVISFSDSRQVSSIGFNKES